MQIKVLIGIISFLLFITSCHQPKFDQLLFEKKVSFNTNQLFTKVDIEDSIQFNNPKLLEYFYYVYWERIEKDHDILISSNDSTYIHTSISVGYDSFVKKGSEKICHRYKNKFIENNELDYENLKIVNEKILYFCNEPFIVFELEGKYKKSSINYFLGIIRGRIKGREVKLIYSEEKSNSPQSSEFNTIVSSFSIDCTTI